MALIRGCVSKTLEGSADPKSQNGKMKYTLVFKFHDIFEFYLGIACWKPGRSDSESQTNPRNGMDFEILTDFFESHGYPDHGYY